MAGSGFGATSVGSDSEIMGKINGNVIKKRPENALCK